MTGQHGDSALIAHWRQQNVWSKAAGKVQSDIARARTYALLLTTAAAVLGTASAQISHWNATAARVTAVLAAVLLALVPLVGRGSGPAAVQNWTRARSISEAIKAEVFTYLAGVRPYRGDDRRRMLQDRLEEITDGGQDLAPLTAGLAADERPTPHVQDVASYIEIRLDGQITGYYRPKAEIYRKRMDRLRRAENGVTVLAAVLAVLAGVLPRVGLSAWIAVVAATAAAIAAHAAAQRYEFQQIEFARTADQLERLKSRYRLSSPGEDTDDRFVTECERVISIQNEGWMAKVVSTDEAA